MIEFYVPREEDIHALQQQTDSFYWSGCVESLFRKHGFPHCVQRPLNAPPKGLPIVLRGAKPSWSLNRPMVIEGPLSESLLSELGLTAEIRSCKSLNFFDANKNSLGLLLYSKFLTKRIPEVRGEITEPILYFDKNNFWNNDAISVQVFKPSGVWYPAAYARLQGDESPLEVVAVTDGKRLIVGAPLFDIILYNHAQPALEEGFYKTLNGTYLFKLEKWLIQQACDLATLADIKLKNNPIWPEGCQAGFTIRHDYDRPISDVRLEEILAFYQERQIKATWFLLVDKPPSLNQINRMVEEGHEIALHSIAPYFKDFKEEIVRFQELTGKTPLGYSCHGGIGSRGQLALTQHLWSESLGLLYGEMIGRQRGLPHQILKPDGGIPVVGRLVIQDSHNSLDLGMKPEAHQLNFLSTKLPERLSEGSHVVLMNHPDIHWTELQILIDQLDLSNVWHCTLEENARWARATKFAFNGYSEDFLEPCFSEGLKKISKRTGKSKKNSEIEQIIPKLTQEIAAWFDQEASTANPVSKLGTIKANTIDLPNRINHLLSPIKDKVDLFKTVNFLDIGCGYGGIPIFLAKKYPNARVTAIDTSDRFFKVGQKVAQDLNLDSIRFQIQDILNIADRETYNTVIVSNVLNYLTNPKDLEKACSNVMKALKPGGWAVIHTPHFWSYREPFTKLPMLQYLPMNIRERIARYFKKRSSLRDVRLPSFFELQRFIKRYGGQIKIKTHETFFKQFMSTHITIWVEKNDAV